MKMSFSEICQRAKEAACIIKDLGESLEADAEFRRLARASGLGMRKFTYYVNAYEAAGESGVGALTYRRKPSPGIMEKGMITVNGYLSLKRGSFKDKAPRAKIDFEAACRGNQITLYEVRPVFNEPAETSRLEVCQMRYTDYDKRWHLYWMRKFNRWWPYVPVRPVFTIEDCVREVETDKWGCFWE